MIGLWLRGTLVGRTGRLLGSIAGLALTVALLASLGTFVASSAQTMARRAIANVPVDWQVLLAPTADAAHVSAAILQAAPGALIRSVGYADTAGLTATTGTASGATTQTTGAGQVIGLDADYTTRYANQIQLVLGSADGVLIATQTAANLHVTVGDTVTVQRIGVAPVDVKIAGVVTLPNADSMFQAIGVPKGTAPQAPPDNVLLMPMAQWHTLFDAQRSARPDTVRTQLHVRLDHAALPADPSAAYVQAQGLANNVEVRVAGSAAIANNLAARLDGVRADALYARVLFLFLGAPGVVLALLVTLAVTASGADRRRREQGLLRIRGASVGTLVRLAAWEAAALGGAGVLLGLGLAAVIARVAWQVTDPRLAAPWFALAAVLGFVLASAAFVVPAWREATRSTVAASRSEFAPRGEPLWQRIYLDGVLLAIGGAVFWNVAQTGYQIVLATEGVAQTSVRYEAFLAPLCLWLGAGLLWVRRGRLALRGGVGRLAGWVPGAGALAPLISASLARQRHRIAGATALVSLAVAVATATAIFNTTYDTQSRVDAELTNGADVAVTGTTTAPAGALLAPLRALPGVVGAEPLMHRMAYVGADLQDIFGIDAARLGRVTTLADAYFANHDAKGTLALLQRTPDGVLVAEETVKDFQLKPGDELNLRLQSAADHQYHVVHFHYIGTVREFPTAPKDSFLVANAAYLASQTGSAAAEVVLLRTAGGTPGGNDAVARAARAIAAAQPGMTVTTLGQTQAIISSSLTAVDLRRLTRLELGFAVLLIAGIAGIVLGLNLAERRRSFAILTALGAKASQVGAFLWSEGLFVVVGGLLLGTATGLAIAKALVAILAGAFDPPPEALVVPWLYLGATTATALACATLAILLMRRLAARPDLEALRAR
ncbi:MAG: FtsX-like permease family protein [Burkholderiales bacterium]|nr:FtsX-like permease family protein [Burkholderiales bacterium]